MFLDGDRNEYGLTIADPKRGIFHQFKVNYCGEFFPVGDSLYQDIVMETESVGSLDAEIFRIFQKLGASRRDGNGKTLESVGGKFFWRIEERKAGIGIELFFEEDGKRHCVVVAEIEYVESYLDASLPALEASRLLPPGRAADYWEINVRGAQSQTSTFAFYRDRERFLRDRERLLSEFAGKFGDGKVAPRQEQSQNGRPESEGAKGKGNFFHRILKLIKQ